jgi:hypothetical protein
MTNCIPERLKRWTMPENYFGAEWPEYYRAGFGRHRDSDDLTDSNFYSALKALGGESETVLLIEESHWAVGYVQWIAIHESDEKALAIADDLQAQIEDYLVLDASDWSERENETAEHIWRDCFRPKERIEYIRRHRDQFEFRGFADLLGSVRGRYFGGDTSELVSY